MGRNRSKSPARARGSPPRRSPPSRRDWERSPGRRRSSHKTSPPPPPPPPMVDKPIARTKSPKQRKSISPISRSPSPRTKRLKRAQSDRDAEKKYERENDRNGSRRSHDGVAHRERAFNREAEVERRERRPERDETNGKSSRSRHERSESPRHRRHHSRSPAEGRRAREEVENTRRDENLDGEIDSVSKMEAAEKALEEKKKQKPSFELSGKLADETNRVKGVTLLFNEPPEARKPDVRWRLYVFKAGEVLNEPLYIHRQSCYLFGRERRVADIPTDHPSCSKQHAVIQFRQVEKEQPDGMLKKQVLPYLMDLGSTNKTFLNENPIEAQRYYELFEKDTIKFGNSSREYVLLHENSAT